MSYTHLSQDERYQIQHLHDGGFSAAEIGVADAFAYNTQTKVAKRFDENNTQSMVFKKLPKEAQTVIIDFAYQYGLSDSVFVNIVVRFLTLPAEKGVRKRGQVQLLYLIIEPDPNGTDLSIMDVHEAALLRGRGGGVWSIVERVSLFV